MTTTEMIDKVRHINGAYNWLVLHNMIDEASLVIERHMNANADPFPFMKTLSDNELAKSAAGVLSGIVAKSFCARLNKQDALCLLRLLDDSNGVFSVCDGVSYSAENLRYDWNDAHPGEEIFVGDYAVALEI